MSTEDMLCLALETPMAPPGTQRHSPLMSKLQLSGAVSL